MNEIISCTTQRVKGRSREPQKLKLNFPQKLCSSRFSFFFCNFNPAVPVAHTRTNTKQERRMAAFFMKRRTSSSSVLSPFWFLCSKTLLPCLKERKGASRPRHWTTAVQEKSVPFCTFSFPFDWQRDKATRGKTAVLHLRRLSEKFWKNPAINFNSIPIFRWIFLKFSVALWPIVVKCAEIISSNDSV